MLSGVGTVTLSDSTTVRARTLEGGEWSALSEARFVSDVSSVGKSLRVSEIHYHPADPSAAELAAR